MHKRDLCQSLVVLLWLRGLTLRVRFRLVQVAGILLVVVSLPVLLMPGRRGAIGERTPDVLQSTASFSSSFFVLQVGMLSHFLDQWRSITSNRYVFNMAQGHHLQFRSHSPLFHNFQQFNIQAAAAHHPIILKEEDELLAEGAFEPSSGAAGFYSSVFVVPKHTGGLQQILNLKWFNHYLHIPSFKMLIIRHIQQLFQCGDYAFYTDLQDVYLHIPILECHKFFCDLFGEIYHISGKFDLLYWPQPLGFL